MQKVLFICTHNSARSQMAEGLLRHDHGDRYEAYSAGTESTFVKPLASAAMAEIGIDISGHRSETVDAYADIPMDYVVTVCDSAKETCPYFPARKQIMHHDFEDPSNAEGTEKERLQAFRDTRDEIREWLWVTFGKGTRQVGKLKGNVWEPENRGKKAWRSASEDGDKRQV